MRPALVPPLSLCLLFAGCAGGATESTAGSSSAFVPPSPPAEPTLETGVLAGWIFDEELQPIAGARVAILNPANVTESATDGSFSFPPLAPGSYELLAERLGYDSVGRRATIEAGRTTYANLTLKALEVLEPYHLTVPRTAFVNLGNVFVNDVTELINTSVTNTVFCDPCQFPIHIAPGPTEVLVETTWADQPPVINQDVWLYYQVDWTTGGYLGDGTNVYATYFSKDEAGRFTETAVKSLAKKDKVLLGVMAGTIVNFQHRVDVYTTFAYDGELPDDFTAFPPS